MVERSLRITGVPEVIVKAVMSLYEETTTKVKVGSVVSDKFFCEDGSAPRLCIITAFFRNSDGFGDGGAINGELREILNVDDLVLVSESTKNLLRNLVQFIESLSEKLRNEGQPQQNKIMMCGTEEETSRRDIDPCGMCCKGMMNNSIVCTKCRSWVHRRCMNKDEAIGSPVSKFSLHKM